jgi:hypothetical protein
MVTVVPVTSNVSGIFPFQVFLPAATTGLAVDSKAQAEQIRSVAAQRLGRLIGRLPPPNWPSSTMRCDFTCSYECLVDSASSGKVIWL